MIQGWRALVNINGKAVAGKEAIKVMTIRELGGWESCGAEVVIRAGRKTV